VSITPGQDAFNGQFASKMTQGGITLALGGSVVNALATTAAMGGAAAQTGDGRIKALAAATAVMAGAGAAKDLAANGPSIGISLTVGHTESEQHESTASTVHSGSVLAAGNNVVISATGAGKDSNINIVGSDVSAKQNITLLADNQVNLLAAQDADSHYSESTSKSASVGIAAKVSSGATAYGITAGVSAGRGSADGEATTQINSHVAAGETLTIGSGGDTNIKGAVASGAQVVADVKGNLNIESLQDKATFDSKNQSISVNATVGAGASVSGGVNQGKVHNDYASVQEQSGLRAGDGGFQVKVGGNTDLKGAVISSTAAGAASSILDTGTLTSSDIENHATMQASSIGVSGGAMAGGSGGNGGKGAGPGGVDQMNMGQSGVSGGMPGVVATSDSGTSTTRSGIGAGTLLIRDNAGQIAATGQSAADTVTRTNRKVETGTDSSGKIANTFDKNAVQAKLDVTAAFGSAAASAIGDYATKKLNEATDLKLAAANEADPDKKAELIQCSADIESNWNEDGAARVALHTVVGGLGGGLNGAMGAGVTALSTPAIAAQIDKLDVPGEVKIALKLAAGATVGAVVGGETGAAAATNEVANNYLKHKEIVEIIKAREECNGGKGSSTACGEVTRLEALDKQRDATLAACDGNISTSCNGVRQEVRSAYAEIIRKSDAEFGVLAPKPFEYMQEASKTGFQADKTISTADRVKGAGVGLGTAIIDGISGAANGIAIFVKAAAGNEVSRDTLGKTVDGVISLASSPELLGKVLTNATKEQHEKIADGYEKGDGVALGKIAGEVLSNFVGGGAGTVGKASKVTTMLEDLAKVGKDVEKAADAAKAGANSTATFSEVVAAARIRQASMLNEDVGFNISPTAWDAYPTIGRNGTFVSDRQGVMNYFGNIGTKTETTISPVLATQIEKDMGLVPGTLQNGFTVRKITGLLDLQPMSPLSGNPYFLGAGNHLPGGAPEMVINSISTVDNGVVNTVLKVKIGKR
jgi:hypothetical protein